MVADEGLTVIELPVPAAVPVQLPENHCQVAPVPRLPPFTVKVLLEPEHSVLLPEADTEAGAELTELTVIVVETQPVLPQVPSARR